MVLEYSDRLPSEYSSTLCCPLLCTRKVNARPDVSSMVSKGS